MDLNKLHLNIVNGLSTLNFKYDKIQFIDVAMSFPKTKTETESFAHINGSTDFGARTDGKVTFEDREICVRYLISCNTRAEAMQYANKLLRKSGHLKINNRLNTASKSFFINEKGVRVHDGFFMIKQSRIEIDHKFSGNLIVNLFYTAYPLAIVEYSSDETIGFNGTQEGVSKLWNDFYFGYDEPMVLQPFFPLTSSQEEFRFKVKSPGTQTVTFYIERIAGNNATFSLNGSDSVTLEGANSSFTFYDTAIFNEDDTRSNILVASGSGILKIKYATEELFYV